MRRTPIRKVSQKRAKENREYAKLRKAFLEKCPYCEIMEPCCRHYATQVHHMNHREGKRLLDITWWLPACFACHRFLHDNPQYARESGFLI